MRVVVRLPMTTSKISSTNFRKVAVGNKLLQNMCIRYNEMLLTQGVTAACNALYPVEARFARWLL